jgi:hypothetical protein
LLRRDKTVALPGHSEGECGEKPFTAIGTVALQNHSDHAPSQTQSNSVKPWLLVKMPGKIHAIDLQ